MHLLVHVHVCEAASARQTKQPKRDTLVCSVHIHGNQQQSSVYIGAWGLLVCAAACCLQHQQVDSAVAHQAGCAVHSPPQVGLLLPWLQTCTMFGKYAPAVRCC